MMKIDDREKMPEPEPTRPIIPGIAQVVDGFDAYWRDRYERAAIMEFEGGMDRLRAERLAITAAIRWTREVMEVEE